MGKLITFEGTDCSGKETQTDLIVEKLRKKGYKVAKFALPYYSSPTGKIIAGPYLGKFGEAYFEEGATNVDPYAVSLYYTADRVYNRKHVEKALEDNDIVILDRYMHSNLAHQGSKFINKEERERFYQFMETLEFDQLKLTKPNHTFFLHMPTDFAVELRKGRAEKADQHESQIEYLKTTEKIYLELCERNNFIKISCVENNKIKTIEEINNDIFKKLLKLI